MNHFWANLISAFEENGASERARWSRDRRSLASHRLHRYARCHDGGASTSVAVPDFLGGYSRGVVVVRLAGKRLARRVRYGPWLSPSRA
jgi:hypothetical protein